MEERSAWVKPGGQKIFTKEEWEEFLEEECQACNSMVEQGVPLYFYSIYTVTNLRNGKLKVQCGDPKVAVKGLPSLYGCPFIIRYPFYFHSSP